MYKKIHRYKWYLVLNKKEKFTYLGSDYGGQDCKSCASIAKRCPHLLQRSRFARCPHS